MNTNCPPVDRLLAFASGELTDDQSAKLEGHIDSCAECRAVLSNVARGGPPPALGRYRIDTVLGSGGMGIVYRAWDPQLARPVAIKVVRRANDDEAGRARLIREAQALARLSHPNVCHVYDVGTEGDEVWVAMELIDGVSLRQWAGDGRTREEVIDVLIGAAEGISAAHAVGLVHRDIKPENVLVTRDGRAIVTDFGLARNEDIIDPKASTLSNDPHLTATGAIAGTPAYLAPEQLLGDPIDARVDQFAWAVMAYELLTGTKPFPIVFAIRVEAVRAGVKPPASLPVPLGDALVRAMKAAPADRFASMRDLIKAIRVPRSMLPKRGRAPAIAGLVVLGAGGISIAVWQLTKQDDAAPQTVAKLSEPSRALTPDAAAPPPLVADAATAVPVPTPTPTPTVAPAPPEPAPPPPAKTVRKSSKGTSAPPAAAATTQGAGAVTVTLSKNQLAALQSMERPYCRSCGVASIDGFCEIPYDFANPETKRRMEVVDWGKVTKIVEETGSLGDRQVKDDMIFVQGQRKTYRFTPDTLVGTLTTKVGDLLAICPEDDSEVYQWSGGPETKIRGVITLSAPPRIAEAAKYKALHIYELKLAAEALYQRGTIDANRRYLVRVGVTKLDGDLWLMDRYWVDVPKGMKGIDKLAPKKHVWMILEKPTFVEHAGEDKKRLVMHAVAILDEIFP